MEPRIPTDALPPTQRGPRAPPTVEATPPPLDGPARTPATGGHGSAPGTGGLSIPVEDLSSDKLLASASRTQHLGHAAPCLGGIPLLAKLGQGGMGAVYYGFHPRLEIEVAVKVLPFNMAEKNPAMVERFYREAKVAAKIHSPHLVTVSDVNEDNGLFYIVMEFVRGTTAGGCLRRRQEEGSTGLPESEALDICIAACEGLAAAHAQGIVHRDIKPDNILIPYCTAGVPPAVGSTGVPAGDGETGRRSDGEKLSPRPPVSPSPRLDFSPRPPVSPSPSLALAPSPRLIFSAAKLADLGLARAEASHSLTGANACMGTPGYMAPEQAADAGGVSAAADVFSLGATLYALLAGRAPFKGSALFATLKATAEDPHTPLRELRPDATPATAELLDRCLQKKPAERPANGAQLLHALKDCRAKLDIPAPETEFGSEILSPVRVKPAIKPQTPKPRDEKARRKISKAAVLGICAGIAVLALAAGYFWLNSVRQAAEQAKMREGKKSNTNGAARTENERIDKDAADVSASVETKRQIAVILSNIYEKWKSSVVKISKGPAEGRLNFSTSGVIVSKSGHILAVDYAIGPVSEVTVELATGVRIPAKVENVAPGLVLLKIEPITGLEPVQFGTTEVIGENVVAIGFAAKHSAEQPTIIGESGKLIKSADGFTDVILSSKLLPGIAGGPIVNLRGEVIGLIYKRVGDDTMRQCISLSALETFLKKSDVARDRD